MILRFYLRPWHGLYTMVFQQFGSYRQLFSGGKDSLKLCFWSRIWQEPSSPFLLNQRDRVVGHPLLHWMTNDTTKCNKAISMATYARPRFLECRAGRMKFSWICVWIEIWERWWIRDSGADSVRVHSKHLNPFCSCWPLPLWTNFKSLYQGQYSSHISSAP